MTPPVQPTCAIPSRRFGKSDAMRFFVNGALNAGRRVYYATEKETVRIVGVLPSETPVIEHTPRKETSDAG